MVSVVPAIGFSMSKIKNEYTIDVWSKRGMIE